VSRPGRRRRALLLLALALACGGLAASQVQQRVRAVEGRVGPLVSVAVAARDLPANAPLGSGAVAVRRVPARFAPPDALVSAAEAAGLRAGVPIRAGSYLTAGLFAGAGGRARGAGGLRRGERAVEIAVAGGGALAGAGPGTRVDLLVSTEPRDGDGRTLVAMENVELLGLRAGSGGPGPGAAAGPDPAGTVGGSATALATLRVSLRQAVYLAAAVNFAREIRLLVRPPGDRGRAGRFGVGAGDL
jgi:pilus assembly protein CpaB